MKRNFILFIIIALIFVMTVTISACDITNKDIEMPDNSSKQSVSTESDGSASPHGGDESASQSKSPQKPGNGLVDGGDYSANY